MENDQKPKTAIRRSVRLERAKLSAEEQNNKTKKLTARVIQLPEFLKIQNIAGYWPNDNEISPLDILTTAHEMGKSCYLPRLELSGSSLQMQFLEYHPGDDLITNSFGILEPALSDKNRKSISPALLDLVLVPLVAFDEQGRRLGMGKGYYDRTFAFRKTNVKLNLKPKPFLLGIAYDLQKVENLPSGDWDIPLDGVATESAYKDHQ